MGGTIYVLAEMYTTGTTQCVTHTYTNIPGDEDLDAGRIIRFTKKNGIISTVFNNITPCFFIRLLAFNWA
jgi:hypothetical protein